MRFGVSTWNYLKAYGDDAGLYRALRGIREGGFHAELWLAWPREAEKLDRSGWADLRKIATGMTGLTLHSRLIHEADSRIIREELDLCEYLGGSLVVFHPKSFGFPAGSWDFRSPVPFNPGNAEILLAALAYAFEKGVKVALENGPLDLLLAVAEFLRGKPENEAFGFCFDTSHANLHSDKYDDPVAAYLEILGDRIIHIHASDNLGQADDHLVPGTGTILWDSLTDYIKKRNYRGSVVFELNTLDPEGGAIGSRDFFLSRFSR